MTDQEFIAKTQELALKTETLSTLRTISEIFISLADNLKEEGESMHGGIAIDAISTAYVGVAAKVYTSLKPLIESVEKKRAEVKKLQNELYQASIYRQ